MYTIEIVVNTSEESKEALWLDGHLVAIKESIKRSDILEALELMNYIQIKIQE